MINKITLGDSLQLIKNVSNNSVDLIVTDPPYEIQNMEPWFIEFKRVLKNSGSVYIFGNKNMIAENWFSQLKMKNKELLVWYYKNSPKPKGRWRMSMQGIIYAYNDNNSTFNEDFARTPYLESTLKLNGKQRPSKGRMSTTKPYDTSKGALPRDVIECPALTGHLSKERVGHRDQKPLDLITKIILTSSNKNDIVLDAFSGSGTTALACKQTERNFYAFEQNPEYVKLAQQRLLLGQASVCKKLL